MPPTPPRPGPARPAVRSAAELNERIRALFPHRDARLTDEQREEYRLLLVELQQVGRGDVVEAA